ncbi:MAG: hypothetical protein H0W11_05085 [Gemmatimonadetes bacterium]|nr:hypothetical protein [Gemmatimonadota bacterium]
MKHMLFATLLTLPVIVAACGLPIGPADADPPGSGLRELPATVPGPEVRGEDGIAYQAEVKLSPEPGADVGPVLLRPTVMLRNPGTQPVAVQLDGCTVRLRVFRDVPGSAPPVWDWERRRGIQCMQDPYPVTLAPGQAREIQDAFDAHVVLGDSLPPGHYYFTISFQRSAGAIELPAGDATLDFGVQGLSYRAETQVTGTAPRQLRTEVTVTNTSSQRVRLEYGHCALSIRAYRTPERSGRPAWDERLLGRPCPAYLAGSTLRPGESVSPSQFRSSIPVREILGDSLPEGGYYFSASLALNWQMATMPAGEGELRR